LSINVIRVQKSVKRYTRTITCRREAVYALLDNGCNATTIARAMAITTKHVAVHQVRWCGNVNHQEKLS